MTKSNDQQLAVVKEEQFDFSQFYQTYQQIASRTAPLNLSPSYTSERKRRLSSSSDSSSDLSTTDAKRPKVEETLEIKEEAPTTAPGESVHQKERRHRNPQSRKSRTEEKLATIRDSCDCRFCYEDHIIKMRLKSSKPWLNM